MGPAHCSELNHAEHAMKRSAKETMNAFDWVEGQSGSGVVRVVLHHPFCEVGRCGLQNRRSEPNILVLSCKVSH